jgi:MFS family permease
MQRALTIPRALLDFFDALSTTVLVLYIIREVRLTPPLMGLAFALSSVGFVAGSLVAPRVERRLDIGGMIVLGLFLVAVGLRSAVVVVALGYGIPFLLVLGAPLRSASRRDLPEQPGPSAPSPAV